jgi:hypothetical protein
MGVCMHIYKDAAGPVGTVEPLFGIPPRRLERRGKGEPKWGIGTEVLPFWHGEAFLSRRHYT